MKRYRNEIIVCLFLILATLAVFAQIRNHDFVGYDDPAYVTQNHEVQAGWTREGFIRAFTNTVQGHWSPLTLLSHMTDCQFFGLNPAGHHLSSLFLHIVNTLLLFLMLRRMTGTLLQSAFVAALFALHPLHVEPVAWVADRKDLLSAFFWILGMLVYGRYCERRSFSRYLLLVLTFTLGLLSKSMIVTLPCIFLLMDYWPLGRFQFGQPGEPEMRGEGGPSRSRNQVALILHLLWEKTFLFILVGASSILTLMMMQTAVTNTVSAPEVLPSADYFSKAMVSYVTYIGKMFWPVHLAVPYPAPVTPPLWQVMGACAFILLVSVLVFLMGKRRKYLPVGWLWYLISLAPVIGIVKFGPHNLADRYTYIPLIGLFIMIAWGIPDLMKGWRYRRFILGTSAGAIIASLMACSWVQTGYWKNTLTLSRHAIEVTEGNYQAENDMGLALQSRGNLPEAIRHLREAVRLKPDNARLQHNLGIALSRDGKLFEAVMHLSKAVQLRPGHMQAHDNLGMALARMGKYNQAIVQFSEALKIAPNYAAAHNHLGAALACEGKLDQAIAQFSEALKINPDYKGARQNLQHALDLKRKSRSP